MEAPNWLVEAIEDAAHVNLPCPEDTGERPMRAWRRVDGFEPYYGRSIVELLREAEQNRMGACAAQASRCAAQARSGGDLLGTLGGVMVPPEEWRN